MILDRPFVLLLMDGNVRDKVAKDSHTWIASYEAKDKHTAVFTAIDKEDFYTFSKSEIEKYAKRYYRRYGKIKSATLYKDGEFIQGITNN